MFGRCPNYIIVIVVRKKNLVKNPNEIDQPKILESKWLSPNRFVQNDTLVKLDMGQKKPYGGFLLPKFPIKKL
jgi:hypothetical protein